MFLFKKAQLKDLGWLQVIQTCIISRSTVWKISYGTVQIDRYMNIDKYLSIEYKIFNEEGIIGSLYVRVYTQINILICIYKCKYNLQKQKHIYNIQIIYIGIYLYICM